MKYALIAVLLIAGCHSWGPQFKPVEHPSIQNESMPRLDAPPESIKEKASHCPDEADSLALDRLYPLIGETSNGLSVWISGDYSNCCWPAKLEQEQRHLDRLRAWAEKIDNECARNAYLHWIAYYQTKLNSAVGQFNTHNMKRAMENYERKNREDEQRTRKYAKAIDGAFPSPKEQP